MAQAPTIKKPTAEKTTTKKETMTNNAAQAYNPTEENLIKFTRKNNTKNVVSSYKYDKSDPIGYNPILTCCSTIVFPKGALQKFNCNSSYEVFEKSSQAGGAKDREKYRRYNNSHDCVKLRPPVRTNG